jgi:selenocysteine-specific elongation factor
LRVWLDEARAAPLIEQAPRGIERTMLMQLTGLPPDALALPGDAIEIAPHGRAEAGVAISRSNWERLRSAIVDALSHFHQRSPDEQGPDVARLRRIAAPLAGDAVWRASIDALVADGSVARSGAWLHLPTHSVMLDAREEVLAAQLRPLLVAGRFDPPWVRELARDTRQPEDSVRTLLRKLARLGGVYQVVRDLFYDPDAVRELARVVERIAAQAGGAVGAAAFRDATGVGRKRAIQILEFFDRVGYTRFQRDVHLLRNEGRFLFEVL